MSLLRVAVDVTELRPGAVGGVRTGLRLLLEALRRHAPQIDVVAIAPDGADVPPEVRFEPTGGPSRPRLWRRSRALRRYLSGFDLFHSPVTAVPPFNGLPMTATVHELPFAVSESLEGPFRAFKQVYWLDRMLERCRACVVPSQATLQQMQAAHPASVKIAHVVPHPCPPIPHGEPCVHDGSLLFVGRLERRKGVRALLLGATDFTGAIRLVGPQPPHKRRQLERLLDGLDLDKRVEFLGVVGERALDGFYRRARAVALLSASEGFGFPVLEALARGTPIIVARGTGAAETGGEAALVVNPLQPVEIAGALERSGDEDYRRQIALEGPRRAASFTPERTARAYERIFLESA
ncbi:MAG: glycosyltransferase [Planctomycetota bacterium]|nr:glycosyltransferase [Planctomycetota bacterium]